MVNAEVVVEEWANIDLDGSDSLVIVTAMIPLQGYTWFDVSLQSIGHRRLAS